jgi:hypothetical protein
MLEWGFFKSTGVGSAAPRRGARARAAGAEPIGPSQSTTPPKAEYIRLATLAGHRAHLIPRLRWVCTAGAKVQSGLQVRRPAFHGVIALLASCQIWSFRAISGGGGNIAGGSVRLMPLATRLATSISPSV